jgi:hypothetical protein
MRRSSLYAALALFVLGSSATTGEEFEQWSLESQVEGIVAFKVRPSVTLNDKFETAQLAFICNQEGKYVVGILAPPPGTFKSEQKYISVAIQNSEDGYDSSDLLQRWENADEYIFSEMPDDLEELASYLKSRETAGSKSIHFYFPNDPDTGPQTTNHIVIDLSGFSSGIAAFKKQCEQSQ